ncbi:MAG: TetR/AcrR family transcriptional regulator [Deltaproteobacteria bacterium]|nr:TetR/AcrR family transcriptional regulator [Deltaproteobacteria bacterium]
MSAHSDDSKFTRDPIQTQLAQARRDQILDAATEIFAQRGFHRATIKAIARQGKIAEGTIYNYFANKTELLFGLLDRLNETEQRPAALGALVGESPASGNPASGNLPAMLEALIRHRLKVVREQLPLLRAVIPELLFNEDLRGRFLSEILAPTIEIARGAFDGLTQAGAFRSTDTDVTVRLVAGLVSGTLFLEMLGDPVLSERHSELPEQITRLLLEGLSPPGGES